MTTLEKILQEIEDRNSKLKGAQLAAFCPEWARNIIKKYISLENNAETERPPRDNDGWIPCSDRVPEESLNSVIGWDEYRERCCFVQYYNGRWILGNDTEPVKIIAWRPLPEPYKQKVESFKDGE